MGKAAHIRFAAAARAIGINNTILYDFSFYYGHWGFRLGIIYNHGINPSVAFQNAEDNHFSCRTAAASALAVSPKQLSSNSAGQAKTSSAAKAK